MSSRYTADGRRKSSMTHAKRGHKCDLCTETVFGNGGRVSHGRAHVRRGEAVELVKEYEYSQSPTRFFVVKDDPRIARWLVEGFVEVHDG